MPDIPVDSFEGLNPTELVALFRRALSELERERAEKAGLQATLLEQRREIEHLKDEIRRLKHLPPRPPIKPSGMEKATPSAQAATKTEGTPPRRRGPGVSKLKIDREETLKASAPEGSRRKGLEDIIVQDISFGPFTTLYRRERWETPDGQTILAELPRGVIGGCGPHLHRLVLMLHFQGQMTCERIVTLLNAVGVAISKRQVVRLLNAKLATFQAEDNAVFQVYTPGARAKRGDYGVEIGGSKALPGAGEGQDAKRWSGVLPVTGTYLVVVGPIRGNATYKLRVTVR